MTLLQNLRNLMTLATWKTPLPGLQGSMWGRIIKACETLMQNPLSLEGITAFVHTRFKQLLLIPHMTLVVKSLESATLTALSPTGEKVCSAGEAVLSA